MKTDLVLTLMAVLLGAMSLAIVLLYIGWRQNRLLITDFRARIAAQQIAALTRGDPTSGPSNDPAGDQKTARQKCHLALCEGNGIAPATFTPIGSRIRSMWRRHPLLAISVGLMATVTAIGAVANCNLIPTGNSVSANPTPFAATKPHPHPRSSPKEPAPTASPGPAKYRVESRGEPIAAWPSPAVDAHPAQKPTESDVRGSEAPDEPSAPSEMERPSAGEQGDHEGLLCLGIRPILNLCLGEGRVTLGGL